MATRELPQVDQCSCALIAMALIKKPRYSLRLLLLSILALAMVLAIYREPLRGQVEALLGTRRQTNWIVITGPQTSGTPAALDPPGPHEVIHALNGTKIARNNTNIRMVIEPIADYVDPPVHTSTAGTYQLHHASYKCQLIFTGATRTIYIDHQHRCVP